MRFGALLALVAVWECSSSSSSSSSRRRKEEDGGGRRIEISHLRTPGRCWEDEGADAGSKSSSTTPPTLSYISSMAQSSHRTQIKS